MKEVPPSAREQYFGSLEDELNRERAAVLGRYGRRVELAVAQCQALLDGIDEDDLTAVAAYKAARRVALHAVDDLLFQREMLRLYGTPTALVHQIYRVPPPLGDSPEPPTYSRGCPPSRP